MAAPPSYAHASEPRAVANRKKFREPAAEQPANIMFDRRVVRGSTYSQPIDTPVRPACLEGPVAPSAAHALLRHPRLRELPQPTARNGRI